MQKIKNENGITLVALVITIIVIAILAGISLNLGLDSINSTKDRQLKAELQIIEQAIMIEYTKAVQLDNIEEGVVPNNFTGELISGVPSIALNNGNTWFFADKPEQAVGYKSYFRLTPEHLVNLEIENSEYTYIVNYYTGEVYNETKQVTSTGEDLYIRVNTATITEKQSDTSSFIN